ncbi:MAG: leucine--tRNA ligase [Patescibacteria group bacterium]
MKQDKYNLQDIKYKPSAIEPYWQGVWERGEFCKAIDFDKKQKFYTLVEFPYPSGEGLHVGSLRSWSAMDAYCRKKRMESKNVLYPIGFDAFGLPAENYAIKMKVNPSQTVPKNIARFKKQLKSLGLSFDWSREVDTTDPKYYKWTQWIFLKFFEKGLAYQADVPVNWCPSCKTNLADEEVLADGTHERCGTMTEKRLQKQWLLKITEYAERLLEDLKLVDYSQKIAIQQVNWIGKKEWIDISYSIEGTDEKVVVSTTRPDTNFGATFIVVAPEHPLIRKTPGSKLAEVKKYIEIAKKKSELERISEGRKKTGVFTGLYAVNNLNGKKLPVWVADFALMSVGTGAVVGVPGHDIRDFEFAKEFNLPVVRVVVGKDGDTSEIIKREQVQEEEGMMVNSEFLNGLDIHKATKKIMDYLEEKGWGKRVIRYHLRDWVFSRQHYWGEPIPIVYCANCAKNKISNIKYQISNINGVDYAVIPVPENQLPIELPYLEKYEPSGTGESPLANAKDWIDTQCPVCNGTARRETDTMPNWAGSNWYFLRYLDPQNDKKIAGRKKMDYWMPVDIYQGGFEHTTLHLLYSRFVYKFLFDIGVVPGSEPYAKRRSHGIVLGTDGRKMSKSFGNVINPDEIINKFGADALRIYEMFMGPFDQTITWNEAGVEGCFRFLKRVWQLSVNKSSASKTSKELISALHKTVKKVGSDIDNLKFNTAVAYMMEFVNTWQSDKDGLSVDDLKTFLLILAPFAPHITEELYQLLGNSKFEIRNLKFNSIHQQSWPAFDNKFLEEDEVTVVVQVNGKVRDTIKVQSARLRPFDSAQGFGGQAKSAVQSYVEERARESEKIKAYFEGKEVKKVIYVEGKIINFVLND